jgi:AcrR family transcriptional regulator
MTLGREKATANRKTAPSRTSAPRGADSTKGARTRRRIIQVTEQLLATKPVWELRSADIAREAGIAPATFYSYFDSVSAAVLAVAEELTHSTPRLLGLLDRPWTTLEDASAFVEAYSEIREQRQAAFNVRDAAADGGDNRFDEARYRGIEPLLSALVRRLEERQAAGAIPASLNADALAGVLIAMLNRTATIAPRVRRRGVTRKRILEAAQYVTFLLVGEPPARDEPRPRRRGPRPRAEN